MKEKFLFLWEVTVIFLKNRILKLKTKVLKLKKNIKKNNNKSLQNKLSFKFKYELENLPIEIENIQLKIDNINNELKNSNLYLEDVVKFNKIIKEMYDLKESLKNKEDRWLYLLEMEQRIE